MSQLRKNLLNSRRKTSLTSLKLNVRYQLLLWETAFTNTTLASASHPQRTLEEPMSMTHSVTSLDGGRSRNPDVTTEERVQPWHYTLTGSDQKLHPAVKLHRQQLLQAEEQQDAAFAVLLSTTTLTLSRCKAWTKSSTALQQVFVGRNLITTVLTILWFRPVTTVLRWEHKDNDCSHSWLEITALPVLKHL